MDTKRHSIIFSSRTGNTKELAETIYETLPKENCDYFGSDMMSEPTSEYVYIGFWTNKGIADDESMKVIKRLKNKKIFLFGTAGFGGSEIYFQNILDRIKESIDSSNRLIGEYMCQGKMPLSVRERYVKMKNQPQNMPDIKELIDNFDRALSHPDKDDLDKLRKMIKNNSDTL